MTPFLEIVQPDGSAERHPLGGGEHTFVGRQPREGIALPASAELEAEHLRLTPRRDGCWVSVHQAARVPALMAGRHLGDGLVPWGSEIQLGSLWLKLTDSIPAGARGRPVGGVGLLALLGLGGAVLWLLTHRPEAPLPAMTDARPPGLFAAEQAEARCPEGEPAAAGARADEAADAARAKSERYPFAAEDGVSAVELYGLAARCFAAAGRDGEAQRATRERAALVARIEEDYRTRRLGLERALADGRMGQALVEARALLGLLGRRDTPFTTWLRALERQLSLETKPEKR